MDLLLFVVLNSQTYFLLIYMIVLFLFLVMFYLKIIHYIYLI